MRTTKEDGKGGRKEYLGKEKEGVRERGKERKGGKERERKERSNVPPSPSIYFFRSRLRRGTCREGKRLSPRAKAKHRKSLKRASAGVLERWFVFEWRGLSTLTREHRAAYSRPVINAVVRSLKPKEWITFAFNLYRAAWDFRTEEVTLRISALLY